MADIYQIPESGNTPQFTIPIGGLGNGGGMFGGNGQTNLMDLLGFAIVASIFPNFFGGGNMQGQCAVNSDIATQAVISQGEASRTAIQTLASSIGQDFDLVFGAVSNVQNMLATIGANQGMNALQVINAIQAGDANLAALFQQCCCQNQLSMCQQTNTLLQGINGVQQSLAAKSAADQLAMCQQTYALTDTMNRNYLNLDNKIDALESSRKDREITALTAKIAALESQNFTTGVVQQAVTPILGSLSSIKAEVDAIKRSQPDTITLPNNSMTAVPTIWANAVADNIVDRIATALTPTTTGGATT